MRLLLVSDIFGRTPALEKLRDELKCTGVDTSIIDPYNGKFHSFRNQDNAYSHFMTATGLDSYVSILENHIRGISTPHVLVGFSIGASIIWKLSGSRDLPQVKKAFGFYGSQIRNMIEINPLFEIELIFPTKEPHFSVDKLIRQLEAKPNVTCLQTGADHGFMNHLSEGFDAAAYQTHMELLKKSLKDCFNHDRI